MSATGSVFPGISGCIRGEAGVMMANDSRDVLPQAAVALDPDITDTGLLQSNNAAVMITGGQISPIRF